MNNTDPFVANIGQMLAQRQERTNAAYAVGLPALRRLLDVAQNDTGQSRICGRFLLGMYNGSAYPFNLIDLRCLDDALWQDCIAVLSMGQRPNEEVHHLIENGPAIWEALKAALTTERDRRAWEG